MTHAKRREEVDLVDSESSSDEWELCPEWIPSKYQKAKQKRRKCLPHDWLSAPGQSAPRAVKG